MYSLYLLGICVFVFFLQLAIPGFTEKFIFDPRLAFVEPWRIITSIFLHGGFLHLFFNGWALFLFGPLLERKVGSDEFLKIFFFSGVAGTLFYWLTILLGIIPPLPALGASGAIFGVMGALAVFMPDLIVYVWYFPMRMREAIIFWFILEFIGTFDISSGIASAAHLGGLIAGYFYAKWLKEKLWRESFYPWY